jgi:hypothetical protein
MKLCVKKVLESKDKEIADKQAKKDKDSGKSQNRGKSTNLQIIFSGIRI